MEPSVEVIEGRLFDGVVADEIVASMEEALSEKRRCSVVLSGGSTPGGTYRALTKPPRVAEINWGALTLYLGDERWVPLDHHQSNARMVQETLLAPLLNRKPTFHCYDTSLSPAQGASKYADLIRKNECPAGEALPQFDLVLLGVGEDGHVASIFPNAPQAIPDGAPLCFSVVTPGSDLQRVTLSIEALLNAKRILFLVKGESKADIMRRILRGSETSELLPARRFLEVSEKVRWFLDSAAGLRLEGK